MGDCVRSFVSLVDFLCIGHADGGLATSAVAWNGGQFNNRVRRLDCPSYGGGGFPQIWPYHSWYLAHGGSDQRSGMERRI